MLFCVFRNTSTALVLMYEILYADYQSYHMKADLLEILYNDSTHLKFSFFT
jgi:hypothetical protein